MLNFIRTRIGQSPIALVVVGVVMGIGTFRYLYPSITTTNIIKDVQTVVVEKPILTERIVDRIIKDPKDQELVRQLLNENKKLKADVIALTVTVATLTTTGGTDKDGVIAKTEDPSKTVSTETQGSYEYKDFQLQATYSPTTFHYDLFQEFRVVTSTGRDNEGNKVGLVKLFQVTPTGLVPVPSTTTAIFADEAVARWRVSPRFQAGIAKLNTEAGGVVAFQWLKHGKSTAAEDIAFAVGSPALFIGNGKVDIGLLPISFNTGRIKHNPLTNLWVSPMLTRTRVGAVVSATF